MNNQKTLLSFVLGAAAGVAAGMLLAPSTGSDTRRKIVDTANSLKNDLGGQFGDTLNKFSEIADSALATVSSYTGKTSKGGKTTGTTTGNTGNTGTTPSSTPSPNPTGQL
jgi:gas vesicle protein